jgi:hypothetical protein
MQYPGLLTFREVTKTAALPAPAQPFYLPPLVVEKLRGMKNQYDAVLDAALVMEGYERGGCALDLKTGLVYPPGSLPRQENAQ